jgi:hypothetical protein
MLLVVESSALKSKKEANWSGEYSLLH